MGIVRYRIPDATAFTTERQARAAADLHSDHGEQAGYRYVFCQYRNEGWFVQVLKADETAAGWLKV